MQKLKQEEARRVKEKQLHDRLETRKKEEEEFSTRNLLKIQTHWREVMRTAKVEELKKEVAVLAQSYEREVDRKDAIIGVLIQDLGASEEQYQRIVRAHLQHIDGLISLHDERAALLETDYERRVAVLRADFDRERLAKIAQHQGEAQELKAIMAAMDEEYSDKRQALESAHHSFVEDLKRTHQESLAAVSSELRTEVLDLYSAFRQAMDNYNMHTENRQTQFKADKKQDKKNAALIARNHRLIKRLQALKEQIRGKIATNDREFEERNRSLRQEKEAVAAHFLQLKARMTRFRDGEMRRLTDLTIASEACLKSLNERLAVAERILSVAEINRKLETEAEQILPFARPLLDTPGAAGAGAAGEPPSPAAAAPTEDAEGDAAFGYLDGFHRRLNKVLLDKVALDQEKGRLLEENTTLKAILQRYLDGISVSPAVLQDANPLFIVNGNTNFTRPSLAPGQVIPVTDLQTLVVVERRR